ncbi:hypothetical protein P280DRAFT_548656 [Massarina eburnea CBS 473.64]|uniref:Anaphase-promoting complex subunit 4 n=1 Tax=Massarina eburnea CBS 473.64 TaxID=1395130 RepID=A0A6A6S6L5_9PLEO|nr:hypothetical protein P280DRAFT_548656 [Massarina eburnea CBS 473.64]
MEPSPGPRLLQQAEKILLRPIHAHLITYCPTMDLIALVTDEENLDVYRINGQRAFGLKRKSEDVSVAGICWQWNGLGIAVCWSDGGMDVVGCETGKVVHRDVRLPSRDGGDAVGDEDEEDRKVSLLGWGLNFIDVEEVKRRTGGGMVEKKQKNEGADDGDDRSHGEMLPPAAKKTTINLNVPTTEEWDAFKDDTTLEDFLQRQPDFETLDIAPDLPDQLAMMDMENLLPKLPPIPLPPANPFMMRAAKADAGAFSSQAQVDGLLHSHHLRDHNSVDMLIRCTEKGSVHPSIYDSMETVDIRLPEAWGVQSKPLAHTSHPYACTHGLLMEVTTPLSKQKKIAYVPLTLGFIPSAGIYLHLIASKTAQLQNLLSYLTHTLSRIKSYFTHAQDLPGKFMRNIAETLEERNQGGLVENLYHLACTGHCPATIHEWLVDELAEQGHKRWDNAVVSGFSTVIQLLHENLLPAVDRCSIVISRLRGLKEFHEPKWIFSGPTSDFTALLELLKSLRLLAHTTLLYAADEKRHFMSFSKWLRYSIDFEATEAESQSRAEMEAKDPGVDVGVVLSYIEHNMARSDLTPYLTSAKDVGARDLETNYEDTKKAVEMLREGVSGEDNAALCLEGVLGRFGEGVGGLLKQVSMWQEENVSMDCGIILEEEEVGAEMDMRMVYEANTTDPDTISTYIALHPTTTPSTLHIHHLTHPSHPSPSPSTPHTHSSTTLHIPSAKILDAKFADDKSLLLLIQSIPDPSSPTTHPQNSLISIPYTSSSPSSSSSSSPSPPSESDSDPESPTRKHLHFPYTTHSPSYLPHNTPSSKSKSQSKSKSTTTTTTLTLTPTLLQTHTRHTFEGRFTPLKLIPNGRKARRVVVVLGSDRKHYRVLDLDFKARNKKDGDGDGEDEDHGGGRSAGRVGEVSDDSEWSGEDSDVEMGGA